MYIQECIKYCYKCAIAKEISLLFLIIWKDLWIYITQTNPYGVTNVTYNDIDEIKDLNPSNKNLTVLQFNIRSLLSKQNDFNYILTRLHTNKSLPKIILLCETHLNDSKIHHINIPNYNTLSCNRTDKMGGGVAILIHKSLRYKEWKDLNQHSKKNFECIFIELINWNKKATIIGSIYHPPNTCPKDFCTSYQNLLNIIKKEQNKNIILRMDHNLDLLKINSHVETQKFLDINFEADMYPCITWPTRITKTSATLIDNIFINKELHNSFDACILVHDLSNHLPCIVNIHDIKNDNNEQLVFESHTLSNDNIQKINQLLMTTDWSQLHGTDLNKAFQEFQNKLDYCLNKIAPIKRKIIPSHKIWGEPWITKGLARSMDKCSKII